jgi:hypothetical protein
VGATFCLSGGTFRDACRVSVGLVILRFIGQLPLEHLDFVVDLCNRSLIGNPAHSGEHLYEMY